MYIFKSLNIKYPLLTTSWQYVDVNITSLTCMRQANKLDIMLRFSLFDPPTIKMQLNSMMVKEFESNRYTMLVSVVFIRFVSHLYYEIQIHI